MKKLFYLLCLFSVVFLFGCGQTVVETLNIPPGPRLSGAGAGRTIVILPFADYTYASNLAAAYRRNLTITETLTDRLVVNGFSLPVQEDVFSYLVDQEIIKISNYDDIVSKSIRNELENDWSDLMKAEHRRYQQEQMLRKANKISESPGTHGLSRENVSKIGRVFNADYVVRGRILEYRTRQEGTWAPWKRGLLPFITGTTKQVLWGFAESDYYDMLNETVSGGILGAAIGSTVDDPYPNHKVIFGDAGIKANTVVWGAAGALAGKISDHSGRIDQAVVQLRVWVQEAVSGNVVWTNRVDVKVSPVTVLADGQYDALFNTAINKGVTTLVNDFVSYGL